MQQDADQDDEDARVEYAAAHDAYLHYDNFSWQVGSVLVAGAFVFWGFLLDRQDNVLLLGANLVVCLLMSVWLLYSSHNRLIYLYKLHRVCELEKRLKMHQHRRFAPGPDGKPDYPPHWPSGHVLNYFIYTLVSLGGPSLVVLGRSTPCACVPWLSVLLNSLVVVVVVARVAFVGGRVNQLIRDAERPENETCG